MYCVIMVFFFFKISQIILLVDNFSSFYGLFLLKYDVEIGIFLVEI